MQESGPETEVERSDDTAGRIGSGECSYFAYLYLSIPYLVAFPLIPRWKRLGELIPSLIATVMLHECRMHRVAEGYFEQLQHWIERSAERHVPGVTGEKIEFIFRRL